MRRQHGKELPVCLPAPACSGSCCLLLLHTGTLPAVCPSCPASGMGFSPPRAQDLSPFHAPLFNLQHPPCQGWDIAAGPWAAVGTESGTSLALSPPLDHAPCRGLRGVLGCLQADAEHWYLSPQHQSLQPQGEGQGQVTDTSPPGPGGSTTLHVGTASPAQATAPVSLHQSQPCHPTVPPTPVTAVPRAWITCGRMGWSGQGLCWPMSAPMFLALKGDPGHGRLCCCCPGPDDIQALCPRWSPELLGLTGAVPSVSEAQADG